MSEMIERLTKVLLAELHRQGDARGVVVEDNGKYAQVDGSFLVEPIARAMLVAMRNPSEAMQSAGAEAGTWDERYSRGSEDSEERLYATEVWQSMIDAALEESGQ